MRFKIGIRLKIVSLLTFALIGSLLTYSLVGSNLFVSDKISYIYDYNLGEVTHVAEQVEKVVRDLQYRCALLTRNYGRNLPPDRKEKVRAEFERLRGDVIDLNLLHAKDASTFELEYRLSENSFDPVEQAHLLGWKPSMFTSGKSTHIDLKDDILSIGTIVLDQSGNALLAYARTKLSHSTFAGPRDFWFFAVQPSSQSIVTPADQTLTSGEVSLPSLMDLIHRRGFNSGVIDWNPLGQEYVVGYRQIGDSGWTVLGGISKVIAFSASKNLVQRYSVLGVSILLISIGFGLILIRTLTQGLLLLAGATERVSSGDFTSKLDLKLFSTDEVGGLASSFNSMSDKIGELLIETAEKARIEKEIETAQLVQRRYFPTSNLDLPTVSLAGFYQPASECSGDWWYYDHSGRYITVIMGDATGHGVSAALITAAAHGTFSLAMSGWKKVASGPPDLMRIVPTLNQAIFAAGGSQTAMTMLVAVIDTEAGTFTFVNAGHRPPYLCRGESPKPEEIKLKPLIGGQCAMLGTTLDIQVTPVTTQLEKGDSVIIYTDGLIEGKGHDGKQRTRNDFLSSLKTCYIQHKKHPADLVKALTAPVLPPPGSKEKMVLDDDITVAALYWK